MTDSKTYASDDANYTGARTLLRSARPLSFHGLDTFGRMSPTSLRSLPRDIDDRVSESGADIPDIALRRPPRAVATPGRPSPDEGISSSVAMNEVLAATRVVRQSQGPINPSRLQYSTEEGVVGSEYSSIPIGPDRKPTDIRLSSGVNGAKSPGSDEEPRRADTRSPSTYQRSILSGVSKPPSISSSYQTNATSLAALQAKAADDEALEPLYEEELEPGSFDLVAPGVGEAGLYSLERRSELLFSKAHLQQIFDDSGLLQRFTDFLCSARPASVPLLMHYLDALKALRAIGYANAVAASLDPLDEHSFTRSADTAVSPTVNESLAKRVDAAFEALAREDLPAYITYVWIQTVSVSIKKRICGTLPQHLRDKSEGLAEVFCLTDPSRHDNPIVFASEEFHRTTQYGMSYVLGQNCRFLQGPKTNPFSIKRIRDKLEAGKEHSETFLNYRRDGSPFMNLLMVAPLYDSRGVVRYFIGAQVDVSGLAKDCVGLESLRRLVASDEGRTTARIDAEDGGGDGRENDGGGHEDDPPGEAHGAMRKKKEQFRQLCEMFSMQELEVVRRNGGGMHRLHREDHPTAEPVQHNWQKPRVLIRDEASSIGGDDDQDERDPPGNRRRVDSKVSEPTSSNSTATTALGGWSEVAGVDSIGGGQLTGVYEHYLLVRPYPSLKILFASPSLRVPGILQSSFMSKIGGSLRVREELQAALAEGHGVTARVRWVSKMNGQGRHRWIHCTPLLGGNGAIGVWMVVITDDDSEPAVRRPREAPPVDAALRHPARLGPHRHRHQSSDASISYSYLFGRRSGVTPTLAWTVDIGQRASGSADAAGSRNCGDVASPRSQSRDDLHSVCDGTRSSSPYTLTIGAD